MNKNHVKRMAYYRREPECLTAFEDALEDIPQEDNCIERQESDDKRILLILSSFNECFYIHCADESEKYPSSWIKKGGEGLFSPFS
jgi:hypothetical protein